MCGGGEGGGGGWVEREEGNAQSTNLKRHLLNVVLRLDLLIVCLEVYIISKRVSHTHTHTQAHTQTHIHRGDVG